VSHYQITTRTKSNHLSRSERHVWPNFVAWHEHALGGIWDRSDGPRYMTIYKTESNVPNGHSVILQMNLNKTERNLSGRNSGLLFRYDDR